MNKKYYHLIKNIPILSIILLKKNCETFNETMNTTWSLKMIL